MAVNEAERLRVAPVTVYVNRCGPSAMFLVQSDAQQGVAAGLGYFND